MANPGNKEKTNTGRLNIRHFFNFITDCFLIISGCLMIYSGLIIQFRFHLGRRDIAAFINNPEYLIWKEIHKIAIVLVLILAIFHVFFHLKWYLSVIRKNLKGKNKLSIILTVVFFLTAITGIIPWIIEDTTSLNYLHAERHLIEIHDKLGLILTIIIILHIAKKLKWLKSNFKKYFSSKEKKSALEIM